MWPFECAREGNKCLEISAGVKPGHVVKLPFLMARMKVSGVGQPAAAWRNEANSEGDLEYLMMTLALGVGEEEMDEEGVVEDCDDEIGKGTSQRPSR